ncbi:hypothetical protein SAMN05443144_1216 [Fodinibius roseus]|uniref:Uncharacterized protein n=1 Tax=Fodinibius roseus TaxID=1194090 RepID=A0A1M5HSR4_9BACT|nr:hypothetical protein [Fodinibius roseus]SHG19011.1 hypothetical protein SAMN05443144_1216 [Fodinibius roseus]
MKYRIKIETTHEELFNILLKTVKDKMDGLGVPPVPEQKRYKSSRNIIIKAPIDARDSLEDADGTVKLKYLFPDL